MSNENESKRYKRFLPLANAAEHRRAIVEFGLMSSLPASVVSLTLAIWITPLHEATRGMVVAGVLAGALSWLVIWTTAFYMMTAAYRVVIAEQYQHPPAPQEKTPPVTFYQTDNGWIRGEKPVGQGGEK